MADKRYSFDGEEVTVTELARRVTAYSKPWLAEALKAGCHSVPDLHHRWELGKRRLRTGNRKGANVMRRDHNLNLRKPD